MTYRRACTALLRIFCAAALVAVVGCATGGPGMSADEARWRGSVVTAAEQMVGAPYRYGGRTPAGFDCSGLVAYSYGRAGVSGLPRTAAGLARASARIAVAELRPADLLFFSFGGRAISHVGIYVGDGEFVHAPKSGRSVERASLGEDHWRRELVRAGRLPAP